MLKVNDLTEHWIGSNVFLEVNMSRDLALSQNVQTVPGLGLHFDRFAQRDVNDYRLVVVTAKSFIFMDLIKDNYLLYPI
jgi:hypothetical protein